MNNAIVFLFSGLGSQYFRMGKELFDQNQRFHKWMVELDDFVEALIGESILRHLYEEDRRADESFVRTLYTHPSIFMVEYSLAQMLIEQGIVPDIVLGSSLGEFVAATVAGILNVRKALELVVRHALLFEAYCQPGSMLAILHDTSLYQKDPDLYSCSELAAVNYDAHFVVSGRVEHIKGMQNLLVSRSILCEILPVPYAFHSLLIEPAESHVKRLLKTEVYDSPRFTFVSSLYGRRVTEPSPAYFWEVVRRPIRFSNTIQALEKDGCYQYVDVSPAGTLANFTKRNLHHASLSKCYAILSPFHQDVKNVARLVELFSEER